MPNRPFLRRAPGRRRVAGLAIATAAIGIALVGLPQPAHADWTTDCQNFTATYGTANPAVRARQRADAAAGG